MPFERTNVFREFVFLSVFKIGADVLKVERLSLRGERSRLKDEVVHDAVKVVDLLANLFAQRCQLTKVALPEIVSLACDPAEVVPRKRHANSRDDTQRNIEPLQT